MKQATARFRRPANGGVRLGRARSAARLLMFVLLLAALVLLTLAVFYYTRNTAQAMEAELCQKMLVSAGQTRNNIDYRFEQVKESASALIGTLYPYLNSDADTAVQLEEYAKIRRALSEQLDKHMITRLRLYVPDEKIYSGQKTTLYSLDPLSSLGENGSVYQKRRRILARNTPCQPGHIRAHRRCFLCCGAEKPGGLRQAVRCAFCRCERFSIS